MTHFVLVCHYIPMVNCKLENVTDVTVDSVPVTFFSLCKKEGEPSWRRGNIKTGFPVKVY